jgi:uncharacterized protein (DUF1501 family)
LKNRESDVLSECHSTEARPMFSAGSESTRRRPAISRRDLLRAAGVSTVGLTAAGFAEAAGVQPTPERALIFLMLVGGPSQLETWDPKPDAPADIRGPFRPIATAVPGISIGEHLPHMARRMNRLCLVRTLHHQAAPIHETGQQLAQTGHLSPTEQAAPHVGSAVAWSRGSQNGMPPFVVLPRPIGNTGVEVPHGQSAGALGRAFDPFVVDADPSANDYNPHAVGDRARRFVDRSVDLGGRAAVTPGGSHSHRSSTAFDLRRERASLRDAYGQNTFGQSCLLARRLVESGVRVVTVNMFESVFSQPTWDCHGTAPFSTFADYAAQVLPMFDRAYSALIDDLERRGLLESTLVVATGEFGRTPRINPSGGRDHWPEAWTAVLAGGGTQGGQVVGTTDAHAAEPVDRPVTPAELVATIYHSLRLNPARLPISGAEAAMASIAHANAINELFT